MADQASGARWPTSYPNFYEINFKEIKMPEIEEHWDLRISQGWRRLQRCEGRASEEKDENFEIDHIV